MKFARTEEEMVELLQEALAVWLDDQSLDGTPLHQVDMDVKTFKEVGLLTQNQGILVRFGDVEFQVQVVRSK